MENDIIKQLKDENEKLKKELAYRDEQQEKFKAIFNNANDAIYIADGETGIIVDANNSAEKLLGKTRTELIGMHQTHLHPKEELERTKKSFQDDLRKEGSNIYKSFHVVHKNGHHIPVEISPSIIMLNNKKHVLGIFRNVSEREKAKEELQKSEEQFRAIYETAEDSIFIKDKNLKYVNVNPAMEKLFGQKAENIINKTDEDLFGEKAGKNVLEIDWQVLQGKVIEEYPSKPINGKIHTFHTIKVPLKDAEGNITGLCGIARDITTQKQAEQALKDSEEKYKTVLNNALEGIFVLQGDYVVYANPAVHQITGFTMDGIRNMKFSVAVYEEDRKKVMENYKRRLAGEDIPSYDFRIKANDGSIRWFLLNATKIQWNGKDADLVFVQDIHDRKLAEEALRENEEKYREIVEMSPDGIATLNLLGKVLNVNKAFTEITGFPKEEFIGKNYLEVPTLLKQHLATYKKMFLSIIHGTYDETIDFKWRHKNGEIRDGQARLKLIKKNAIPVKIQVIVRDVTERRKAQELQNEVIVAQNSAKLKQKFLANISHEMRTPMNGIIGMTEFLADTNLNSQQQNYVDTIKESSESLLNIINDVLNLSKIEQGHSGYIFENVNIYELIESTLNIFKAQAFRKKIRLLCHIEKKFPQNLLLDKQNFRQILYNLLSNAVKYTKQGEVKLELQLLKKKGNIITGKATVTDTGIGIKAQDKEKIYDPFVRVDDSFTRTTEGTGLGLSIAKKLANVFGGDIDFESEVNKGSKFWFTFQSEAMPKKETVKKKSIIQDGRPLDLHIMLAEDKELNYKVAAMMLKNLGCTVDIAKNGKEVLELFPKNKYDIILMDIMMPEMDGIEAMNQLKKKYKNLPPIIGLSAHAMEGDAERFIEMGMDDYLEKPINKDKLAERLRKWGR